MHLEEIGIPPQVVAFACDANVITLQMQQESVHSDFPDELCCSKRRLTLGSLALSFL